MATLPDFVYRDMEMLRPHIDTDSFMRALDELNEASDEDSYPILFVAAAIHEFSNMVNENFAELYRHILEAERDKKEEQ